MVQRIQHLCFGLWRYTNTVQQFDGSVLRSHCPLFELMAQKVEACAIFWPLSGGPPKKIQLACQYFISSIIPVPSQGTHRRI